MHRELLNAYEALGVSSGRIVLAVGNLGRLMLKLGKEEVLAAHFEALMHLLGTVVFATLLSPVLYRWVVQSEALEILEANSKPVFVAVRSSATTEDLAEASFAGQQDTYLNVK